MVDGIVHYCVANMPGAVPLTSALALNQDLCGDKTDRTMEVHLVAHNGKESSFSQELATPGCDPTAKISIRRRGRRAWTGLCTRAGSDGV